MNLKQLNENLRPREKALKFGVRYLSDSELLAILLRSGNDNESCIQLAQRMIDSAQGLANLTNLTIQQLKGFKGIGDAKAIEILASCELVKRISFEKLQNSDVIACPNDLIEWLQKMIGKEKREAMIVVFLDGKNRIIGYSDLYKGTTNEIQLSTKDIFNEALTRNATKIIVAHNHPSQISSPSFADDLTTQQLVEAGKLLNIRVVDHIIVGYNNYYSYSQEQKI